MSSILPSPSKSPVTAVTSGNGLTLTSGTLALGVAGGGSAGAMTAADKTKLDQQSGTNTGDVTISSPPGWLTLVGQALTFALVAASDTVAGVVSLGAQTWAGVKTFANTLIASAGIQVGSLWNTNGTNAADVGVTLGVSTADGSVNANARLAEFATGVGGTKVVKAFITKAVANFFGLVIDADGNLSFSNGARGPVKLYVPLGNAAQTAVSAQGAASATMYMTTVDGVGVTSRRLGSGMDSIAGTDSSASPGAATINKPTGKSAIASGASSVVITNSLVTAASRVMITPHARDATCKELIAVPAAGSFTVSGSANATAALPFSWEVSTIL